VLRENTAASPPAPHPLSLPPLSPSLPPPLLQRHLACPRPGSTSSSQSSHVLLGIEAPGRPGLHFVCGGAGCGGLAPPACHTRNGGQLRAAPRAGSRSPVEVLPPAVPPRSEHSPAGPRGSSQERGFTPPRQIETPRPREARAAPPPAFPTGPAPASRTAASGAPLAATSSSSCKASPFLSLVT